MRDSRREAGIIGILSPTAFLMILFALQLAPVSQVARPGVAIPESTPGTLRLPLHKRSTAPAVVIVHASAGLMPNGPESRYAAALADAGVATLVIDMWGARGIPAGPEAFGGTGGVDRRLRRELPGLMAHSLIPIVIGYVFAHYLSYLVESGQQTLMDRGSDPRLALELQPRRARAGAVRPLLARVRRSPLSGRPDTEAGHRTGL